MSSVPKVIGRRSDLSKDLLYYEVGMTQRYDDIHIALNHFQKGNFVYLFLNITSRIIYNY